MWLLIWLHFNWKKPVISEWKVLSGKCCKQKVASRIVLVPRYLVCWGEKAGSTKISLPSPLFLTTAGALWKLDGSWPSHCSSLYSLFKKFFNYGYTPPTSLQIQEDSILYILNNRFCMCVLAPDTLPTSSYCHLSEQYFVSSSFADCP